MFSARTRWDLRPNRLSRVLEAKRREGTAILDLTETNPTRAFVFPPDLLEDLAQDAGLVYEPSPRGLETAREAVAADYARRGVAVGADQIVLTASSSESYAFLFKLLCDPGDEVLIPRPSYPLFEYLAGLESVHTKPYALSYDGRWNLDLGSLEPALTSRTRAVIVVNPNNPTGSFLKNHELDALLSLGASRGLALVSDEVFGDYGFSADSARVGTLASGGPVLSFSLGGLSKSCGLPQLKLGWIAVAGPGERRGKALERLEVIADTFLSVGTPVQLALPNLLRRMPELQRPIAARLATNRAHLKETLAGSVATPLFAEGGWSAILRVPSTVPEEDRVVDLLSVQNVLVHPGYFFDLDPGAHLVLSLLPDEATFSEGLDRVVATLRTDSGSKACYKA